MNISNAIYELIKKASTELPSDMRILIEESQRYETGTAKQILSDILKNADLAKEKTLPMCQDTGALNFFVKKGDYSEDLIKRSTKEATARATKNGLLRPNAVDPLSGNNLGNIPEIHIQEGEFEIKLLLKGGGSENVCAQYKLPDTSLNAGRDLDGVEKCVLDSLIKAQGKGCSPYVVGVCIGGQRESGYMKAKKQLFRKAGNRSNLAELAKFECSVKDRINKLGIGPMGLGGKTTALEVFATTLPRHPAAYFVSISLNCWAMRRWTLTIKDGKLNYS